MYNNGYGLYGYPMGIPTVPKPRKLIHHTNVLDMYDLHDESVNWYPVFGFYGYEINQYGYIRSLKLPKKYPYGLILKPSNRDDKYSLQDPNGKPKRMKLEKIWKLAMTNKSGQVHKTFETVSGPRNSCHFYTIDETNNEIIYPKESKGLFTILPDEPTSYNSQPAKFTVVNNNEPRYRIVDTVGPRGGYCPIYFLERAH